MGNITQITNRYEQPFLNEAADKSRLDTRTDAQESGKSDSPQGDKVSLSRMSKDLQTAEKAVAESPDIRQEKVEEIRQAMETGQYDVNAEKTAGKLIGVVISEMI